jgi:hypothetical protein
MKLDDAGFGPLIPSGPYEAFPPDVSLSSKVQDSATKQKLGDVAVALSSCCVELSSCCVALSSCCAAVTAGVCFMSCVLSVPLLCIIFSQTLRWDANFACGSQDKPTICNCEENFPEFMMILGVVSLVFAALLLCMRGCVGSSEIENCVSVIFSLVELVLSIFMFIYMFTSDPGCGKELFVWGIVLLVFFCIWVLVIFCSVRGLW